MYTTLDQRLTRVATALCDSVSTEVSSKVAKAIRENRLLDLATMAIDPKDYGSASAFKWDYACVELLRKCPFEIPGVDREAKARESFFATEKACRVTNDRLDPLLNNFLLEGNADAHLLTFVDKCRAWIKHVLGPIPKDLHGRFGPGATYGDKGKLTTIPDKMSSRPSITNGARAFEPLLRGSAWLRAVIENLKESDFETVRGNRFTTVPKDALKVRGICIEPSLNVFWQLAVGSHMKGRLSAAGIDLIRGQDLHRQWAQQASRDGGRATIDLSNASDTVAYRLVKLLLPEDWFELLDSLRSPFTRIDGRWVRLEKFSSMGNGFTFELETLIFAAICYSCGSGSPGLDFHVFGDDIIVPSVVAHDVVAALTYFGFTTNKRKTFLDGPFRESCGGDFFDGLAVRPHYLKEIPYEPQHWISLANGLRRLVCEDRHDSFHYSHPFTAWQRCLDAIPSHIRRLRGPRQLGDLVIHDNKFERRWRHGIGYVRVYRPVSKPLPWHHFKPLVVLASALYGCPSEGVIPRSGTSGYKVGFVAYS